MNDMVIRTAERKDAKEMALLDIICFSEPWSEDSFIKELTENKIALYIVAEVEAKIIGYAGVWLVADEGHVTNIAVHPTFRRKQIAENMITLMLKASLEVGVTEFSLEVRKTNEGAKSLYDKMGFFAAGLRKNYYADNGEDAIIMNRSQKSSL